LISKIFVYEPSIRIKPLEALIHPYFDELRDEGLTFPNGNLMPDIFNFTDYELLKATSEQKDIL
jgi:glycogen synthase kinase 3 beta